MNRNYLDLLDELQAIARMGINYSKDPYDLERYRRLLDIACERYAEITGLNNTEIKNRFSRELGYLTPKIGVQGALFNDAGEILLEKRIDDGLWGLPAGWVETGERPEQAIKREFMEEANLVIKPLEIIGFYTRLPGEFSQPHTSVHILYYCRYIEGQLMKSHESQCMEFCDHTLVTEWHKDHGRQAAEAFIYRNKFAI